MEPFIYPNHQPTRKACWRWVARWTRRFPLVWVTPQDGEWSKMVDQYGFMAGLVGVSSTFSGNSPGFFMRRKHLRRCKWGIFGHSNLMKFNEIQWNFHGVLCAFEKFVGVWFCTSLNEYPSIDWSSWWITVPSYPSFYGRIDDNHGPIPIYIIDQLV